MTPAPARLRFAGAPDAGMPPLETGGRPLSWFEFLSPDLFYLPIWIWVAFLALRWRGPTLPALANPPVWMGGFVGESKTDILDLVEGEARGRLAPYVRRMRDDAPPDRQADALIAAARAAGFDPPFVLKPDIGCRGMGVQLAETPEDVARYIADFPAGAALMAQALCAETGEAGVFYVRFPGAPSGEIISLTLKYFPFVTGDGERSLRALIDADPRAGRIATLYHERHRDRLAWIPANGEQVRLAFAGSHSRGAIFRDGAAHITPAMRACFDAIADATPGFHFGRFDVRFADLEALKSGEDFTIIEINAAGGEATHIWDRNTGIFKAWRDLMRQFSLLYAIGAANRARGHRPPRLIDAWRAWRRHKALAATYPTTH